MSGVAGSDPSSESQLGSPVESPTVRAATLDDVSRIAEIHVAAWRWAYRGQMPQAFLDELSVEQRADMWRRLLAEPKTVHHRTWVVETGGFVGGFARTGPCRDADAATDAITEAPRTQELFAINLDPSVVGRGLGRALCTHLLADLRRRGTSVVTLWVLDGNARARRFYEIAGFAADGTLKTVAFGGADLSELRYRATLT